MTTVPISLALGLPAAAAGATNLAKSVGQSFQSLLSAPAQKQTQSDQSSVSLTEQLKSAADDLRKWLSSHGINTPFEIELSSGELSSGDSATPELSVTGIQSQEIRGLLSNNLKQLNGLSSLLKSVQALGSSLGRSSAKLLVTDFDSSASF